MKTVRFRRWSLVVDAAATAGAYARLRCGSAAECTCAPCRNFVAVGSSFYPEVVLELFGELGIDHRREAEAYHLGRQPDGRHLYGAWFHVIGELASRDARGAPPPRAGALDLVPVAPGVELGFSPTTQLVPDAFARVPLVQLEITGHAPWVLDEPAAD